MVSPIPCMGPTVGRAGAWEGLQHEVRVATSAVCEMHGVFLV